MKFSADPRNSADFDGFLVIPEISVNLERNLRDCMGGGYLRTYLTYKNGSFQPRPLFLVFLVSDIPFLSLSDPLSNLSTPFIPNFNADPLFVWLVGGGGSADGPVLVEQRCGENIDPACDAGNERYCEISIFIGVYNQLILRVSSIVSGTKIGTCDHIAMTLPQSWKLHGILEYFFSA